MPLFPFKTSAPQQKGGSVSLSRRRGNPNDDPGYGSFFLLPKTMFGRKNNSLLLRASPMLVLVLIMSWLSNPPMEVPIDNIWWLATLNDTKTEGRRVMTTTSNNPLAENAFVVRHQPSSSSSSSSSSVTNLVNQDTKLFVYWIGFNPEHRGVGAFNYYKDIAKAFNEKTHNVHVCESGDPIHLSKKKSKSKQKEKAATSRRRLAEVKKQKVKLPPYEEEYLQKCWQAYQDYKTNNNNANALFVPIVNHEMATHFHNEFASQELVQTVAQNITSLIQQTQQQTQQQQQAVITAGESNNPSPSSSICISVLLCLNKVYVSLEKKLPVLKAQFQPLLDFAQQQQASQSASSPSNRLSVSIMASTWSPHSPEFEREYQIPFIFCPFATNVNDFHLVDNSHNAPWQQRECDVFVRWDNDPRRYSFRKELDQMIQGNQKETSVDPQVLQNLTATYGRIDDIHFVAPTRFLKEGEYQDLIASCKMTVSTIGMPGRVDLVGTRYYEIQSSGTTLFLMERAESIYAKESYQQYGFTDDTSVSFASIPELLQHIRYYKEHGEEAMQKVQAAQKMSVQRASWEARGDDLVQGILKNSKCY